MKKIFKKVLVCVVAFAMVLTVFVGTLVASAASVTATKGTLTGSVKFLYNINFTIDAEDATAYGALVWREGTSEADAVDVENLTANTGISVSGISLKGIMNVFNVKPYAVIEGQKVYAESFTASYAEWLVSKKDGERYNAEINLILDAYYAMTGTPAYEGQATPELTAPADGNWEALLPFSVGEGAFGLGENGIQGNFADSKLRVNLDYSAGEDTSGGKNYVVNGSFENGLKDWAGMNMPAYVSTTEASEGAQSMAFTTGNVKVWQYVNVDPGKTYIVAFDIKATSANNSDNYTFASIDACNDQHAKYIAGRAVDGWTPTNTKVSPTEWTTITNEITTAADQDMICVYFASSGSGNKPAKWFDNVIVMEKSEYLAFQVKKGEIVNGSFEEGNQVGWTTKWMSAVTSQHSDGAKSIEFDCASAYTFQYVPVERNTTYVISYDYINTSTATTGANTWVSLDFCTADHAKYQAGTYIDGYTPQDGYGAYATEWTTMTYELNSGENDFLCITVRSSTSGWASGVKKYYDNFKLEAKKPDGNIMTNGSFEEGNQVGWTTKWMSAVTSQHSDGAKSIEFDCASAYTFQYVPVERNTNYTISYDYINTSTATTGANTWVSLDFCTADNEKYQAGTYIDGYTPQDGYGAYATEWTTMTYEMNSGENDFLCISVHSSKSGWASGVKKYYDNFKVIPEEVTVKGALVYKAGNEFNAEDVSNADANIVFAEGDILAIDISNIAVKNAANQYTVVPFIKNGSTYTFGAVIKASYADVVAKALNSNDAALKATANAYNEMYNTVMGEYLCKVAE
ncbi:MAG: hypothetical protein E7560_06950 [Ruminococcaceae bacterium]|nr:hypothetical protein [Oscillospiraceae bacterium]